MKGKEEVGLIFCSAHVLTSLFCSKMSFKKEEETLSCFLRGYIYIYIYVAIKMFSKLLSPIISHTHIRTLSSGCISSDIPEDGRNLSLPEVLALAYQVNF